MNQKQRKELATIWENITGLLARIEQIRDEEQEKYDNLPENLQSSSKADEYDDNINNLDEAIDHFQNGLSTLESFK